MKAMKNNLWLVLALMATLLACKGKTWMETAESMDAQDRHDFYASGSAARTESSEAAAGRQKAKTVVMYEIPAPLKDRPEQILKRKGYTVSYNSETKNPNWVAWHLTKSHTSGSFQRSQEVFSEDTDVKAPRATDRDYFNSRYDRGHMCPAGDMKWSAAAMRDCFYMSNVCPQTRELNHVSWERLESACRRWAKKMGSIYIVCGPVYWKKVPEYIGVDHRVAVPDGFFKVVLCLQKGKEKGIAFYYDNTDVSQSMRKAVRSIDQIEKMTRLDFFSELPDGIENRLESMRNLDDFEKEPDRYHRRDASVNARGRRY